MVVMAVMAVMVVMVVDSEKLRFSKEKGDTKKVILKRHVFCKSYRPILYNNLYKICKHVPFLVSPF